MPLLVARGRQPCVVRLVRAMHGGPPGVVVSVRQKASQPRAEFSLRPIRRSDHQLVLAHVLRVREEINLPSFFSASDADLKRPSEVYRGEKGIFLVLEREGEIFGTGGILEVSAGVAELKRFYLAPEARGHGNAERVLSALLEEARARSFHRVDLEIHSRLTSAVAFYERMGFRKSGRVPQHPSADSVYTFDLDKTNEGAAALNGRWTAAPFGQ